ncbi:MAG: RlpA-like double-psi beta-barrel domain-containing protein [Hyphomicrobiaceae bacterium]
MRISKARARRAGRAGALRLASIPLAAAAVLLAAPVAGAKTPGKTYCFGGTCHRVKTIAETRAAVGRTTAVKASYYDDARHDRYNPSNLTSSGEYFRAGRADNVASPIYPDGTKLLVWNPANRKAAMVRVNNAGPYKGNRTLDLSRATADKLGITHRGVATLHVRVVAAPTQAEASYRKGRTYAAVPGFLGIFQSIDMAMADIGRALGLPSAGAAVASAEPERTAKPGQRAPQAVARAERTAPVRTAQLAPNEPEQPAAASAPVAGQTVASQAVASQAVAAAAPAAGPKRTAKAKPARRIEVAAKTEPRRAKPRVAAAVRTARAPQRAERRAVRVADARAGSTKLQREEQADRRAAARQTEAAPERRIASVDGDNPPAWFRVAMRSGAQR